VSCNCNCKPTQAPQSAAALLTSHHAAVSREQRDPLAHAENWFCINPGGSHEIQRLLSFGWVRERKQSTPCTFFHRTGGKKSRCRMIEFSELQSYYCQAICQRMFFSVLSTAKSIPEQMSKSQRCNFLHAAFRFSPHPPIIHHSSPPSFVIINQYPIFILNISILHHAHVSALTTLGFKDYIEPFTSSTTTSSAISRTRRHGCRPSAKSRHAVVRTQWCRGIRHVCDAPLLRAVIRQRQDLVGGGEVAGNNFY
jgi:hypothetical protein